MSITILSGVFNQKNNHGEVTLSAFASDLGFDWLQYFHTEGCDGITIKSQKTGTLIRFRLQKEETDEEGDITHWVFVPLNLTELKQANGVVKVIIWND